MTPRGFYDELADVYHLIFQDWEASMARQGSAISSMIAASIPADPAQVRVLDVASGIGTQALPLARLGFDVTARDLSVRAVDRLEREAAQRKLEIDAAVADMRSVSASAGGPFDVVIAFDNSLPHLLNDEEILRALREFRKVLRPGGILLVSLRDYAAVDRTGPSRHPYAEREDDGRRLRLGQVWEWTDAYRYRTTMTLEEAKGGVWTEVFSTTTSYYAISCDRLVELVLRSGFTTCDFSDVVFYQPVLVARRGS
ncbi:MAG: class I SAM-dependent methyltransferase [Longimicrobiales bacterium]